MSARRTILPIQMKSEVYIPCDQLKPYVKSFAIHENADETTYKVLPDTGLVIGFQFKGRLSRIDNHNEVSLSRSGISGLSDHSRLFKNSPNVGTILIFLVMPEQRHFLSSRYMNFLEKVCRWIISCSIPSCCAWKSN